MLPRRFALICALLLVGQTPATVRSGAVQSATPIVASRAIIGAFSNHPVVVIGEWRHGIQQMGELLVNLVNDPEFQQLHPDIVIEFASRNNQALLDRYVGGEDLDRNEVRRIWRDTTKTAAWEFPMYGEWLRAIRDVNSVLPAGRRLKVWAGDTAIDWSKIHVHSDWTALGDNNWSFADVIMRDILAEHRRALVVLGSGHVAKLGRNGNPNMSTIVESHYPGALYVIIHRLISDTDETLLQIPGQPDAPAILDLANSPLGSKPDANGVPPKKWVDAWLYLGPSNKMTTSIPLAEDLEAAYLLELKRRSSIEWGDENRARRFLESLGVRASE